VLHIHCNAAQDCSHSFSIQPPTRTYSKGDIQRVRERERERERARETPEGSKTTQCKLKVCTPALQWYIDNRTTPSTEQEREQEAGLLSVSQEFLLSSNCCKYNSRDEIENSSHHGGPQSALRSR
jgi:hypothetical protein